MVKVEVCVDSVQSAIIAQKGGASRVELCANLFEGGVTPAQSLIESCRSAINIDLNVIIRPRGGDFLYDDLDFEMMKRDVELCADLRCDGVVFGILSADGNVDMVRNGHLLDLTKLKGLSATFHRAFDRTPDIYRALEDVIDLRFDRVLTSGGCATAYEGRSVIRNLVNLAKERVIVMPGSGININNISELIRFTRAKEVHGTFRHSRRGSMEYLHPNFSVDSEYNLNYTDELLVNKIVKVVNSYL